MSKNGRLHIIEVFTRVGESKEIFCGTKAKGATTASGSALAITLQCDLGHEVEVRFQIHEEGELEIEIWELRCAADRNVRNYAE